MTNSFDDSQNEATVSSSGSSEETTVSDAEIYLESLYVRAFHEALVYSNALHSLRYSRMENLSRQNEIEELNRWFQLPDHNGRQSTDLQSPLDPNTGGSSGTFIP